MTGKQVKVETCNKSPKKGNSRIYGNCCNSGQKTKECLCELCISLTKLYGSSNFLLRKTLIQKLLSTTATCFFQPPTYPTTGETCQNCLLTIKTQCSTLSKWKNYSFLHHVMYNYKKNLTQYYPYDPKKLTNHSILHPEADLVSICRDFFKKTAFFDVVVHLID